MTALALAAVLRHLSTDLSAAPDDRRDDGKLEVI